MFSWIMHFFRGYKTVYDVIGSDIDPSIGTVTYTERKNGLTKKKAQQAKTDMIGLPFTFVEDDMETIGKITHVRIEKRKVPYDV